MQRKLSEDDSAADWLPWRLSEVRQQLLPLPGLLLSDAEM